MLNRITLSRPTSAKERRWLKRQAKNFNRYAQSDEFKEVMAKLQTEIVESFAIPAGMLLAESVDQVNARSIALDSDRSRKCQALRFEDCSIVGGFCRHCGKPWP